jgi:hypothetical protein
MLAGMANCGSRRLTAETAFATLELAANLVFIARCKYRAEVAELADAHGSGPCTRKGVEVQVLSSAPKAYLDDGVQPEVHRTSPFFYKLGSLSGPILVRVPSIQCAR